MSTGIIVFTLWYFFIGINYALAQLFARRNENHKKCYCQRVPCDSKSNSCDLPSVDSPTCSSSSYEEEIEPECLKKPEEEKKPQEEKKPEEEKNAEEETEPEEEKKSEEEELDKVEAALANKQEPKLQ